jgi:hypothetical protein
MGCQVEAEHHVEALLTTRFEVISTLIDCGGTTINIISSKMQLALQLPL